MQEFVGERQLRAEEMTERKREREERAVGADGEGKDEGGRNAGGRAISQVWVKVIINIVWCTRGDLGHTLPRTHPHHPTYPSLLVSDIPQLLSVPANPSPRHRSGTACVRGSPPI